MRLEEMELHADNRVKVEIYPMPIMDIGRCIRIAARENLDLPSSGDSEIEAFWRDVFMRIHDKKIPLQLVTCAIRKTVRGDRTTSFFAERFLRRPVRYAPDYVVVDQILHPTVESDDQRNIHSLDEHNLYLRVSYEEAARLERFSVRPIPQGEHGAPFYRRLPLIQIPLGAITDIVFSEAESRRFR